MGLLFLFLFAIAEIALVVLTATKFAETAKWLTNRWIIRAAETVLLLGMVLLPTTHMKWRFFATLLVLGIRLLIALIAYLAKRKSASGTKKMAGVIVSCVLSVLLVAAALVPSFLFTNYNGLKTTGAYEVKETAAILVDESRVDPFETDGSFREVPAHFYYPAAEGEFPLIIFSHGAFGYYQSNFSTYAELASNGYVVVSLDHPHHAFFTKDTAGKLITVDPEFINGAMAIGSGDTVNDEQVYEITQSWMQLRTDDGNFVIDAIKAAKASNALDAAWHAEDEQTLLAVLATTDTGKIGYMGHSLGGATGVALGRLRDDLSAVVDIDGTALGEVVGIENDRRVPDDRPYPIPVLILSQQVDYDELPPDAAYVDVNKNLVENAKDGRLVSFVGAGHMDFTDLPLFSPFLASLLGTGTVNSEECLCTMNALILNWFNYYLKNEGTLSIQAQY